MARRPIDFPEVGQLSGTIGATVLPDMFPVCRHAAPERTGPWTGVTVRNGMCKSNDSVSVVSVHRRGRFCADERIMPSAEVSSPQRRRWRSVLRQLRTDAGFTQENVQPRMDWSLSKLIRIETEPYRLSVNDFRPAEPLHVVRQVPGRRDRPSWPGSPP